MAIWQASEAPHGLEHQKATGEPGAGEVVISSAESKRHHLPPACRVGRNIIFKRRQ